MDPRISRNRCPPFRRGPLSLRDRLIGPAKLLVGSFVLCYRCRDCWVICDAKLGRAKLRIEPLSWRVAQVRELINFIRINCQVYSMTMHRKIDARIYLVRMNVLLVICPNIFATWKCYIFQYIAYYTVNCLYKYNLYGCQIEHKFY